ncbi:hypothetical protein VTK26DRAFT_4587 [Humicola hyalothermophila]
MASNQVIFASGLQEPFPSLSDVTSATSAIAVNQAEVQEDPTPATSSANPPPKGKKSNNRKKSVSSKAKASKAKPGPSTVQQGYPSPQSQPVQQEMNFDSFSLDQAAGTNLFVSDSFQLDSFDNGQGVFDATGSGNTAVHQESFPSFGLDQVMVEDPFVSHNPHIDTMNNVQTDFSITMPGTAMPGTAMPDTTRASYNARMAAQLKEQMRLSGISMFPTQQAKTAAAASISVAASSFSDQASGQKLATPLTDNKRKASGPQGSESPTKRRQNANNTASATPSMQSAPEQQFAQNFENFQTPLAPPSAHSLYNISPPSGSLPFGTSIKAGICAAIRQCLLEARKCGTILSQMLTEGPRADFNSPETSGLIKQTTRRHILAVSATTPDDDQGAFNGGAFEVLREILQEMEQHGTVFGKQLLIGTVTGVHLEPVKHRMAAMYREIIASYTPPPKLDGTSSPHGNLGNSAQMPTQTSHVFVNGRHLGVSAAGIPSQVGPTSAGIGQTPGNAFSLHGTLTGFATNSFPLNNNNNNNNNNHASPDLSSTTANQTSPPQQQQQAQAKAKAPRKRKTSTRARKSSTAANPTGTPANANSPTAALSPPPSNANRTPSPATKGSPPTTKGPSPHAAGQHVPKSLYHFGDRAYYVQLTVGGSTRRRLLGREGTAQLKAGLAAFLAAAAERFGVAGEAEIPRNFEFWQWVGIEENLERLRGAMNEGGDAVEGM